MGCYEQLQSDTLSHGAQPWAVKHRTQIKRAQPWAGEQKSNLLLKSKAYALVSVCYLDIQG